MNNITYSGQYALFAFIIYLIGLIRYRKSINSSISVNYKKEYIILLIWMIISSVFAFAEHDTYHYWRSYENMRNGFGYFEPIFFYFAHLTTSYWIWRLIIWGTASVLMILASYRLKLRPDTLGLVMTMFFITQFTITRGALGFAMLNCGLVLLLSRTSSKTKSKNFLYILLAIFLISCSIYFHRSIVLFVILLLISFIVPFKKSTILVSIIIFPFLYVLIMVILPYFYDNGIFLREVSEFIEGYTQKTEIDLSINGVIRTWVEHLGWLIFVYALFYYNLDNCKDKTVIFLTKYAFVLIYLSMLMFKQPISPFMSSRAIHAASFPMLFCATYYLQGHSPNKIMKLAMVLFFVSTIVYHFYINISYWW